MTKYSKFLEYMDENNIILVQKDKITVQDALDSQKHTDKFEMALKNQYHYIINTDDEYEIKKNIYTILKIPKTKITEETIQKICTTLNNDEITKKQIQNKTDQIWKY